MGDDELVSGWNVEKNGNCLEVCIFGMEYLGNVDE